MAFETWRALGIEVGVGEPEDVIRARALERGGDRRGRPARLPDRAQVARRAARAAASAGCASSSTPIWSSTRGFRSAALARAERAGRVVRAPEPGRLEVERVHASLAGRRVAVLGRGPGGAVRGARPGAERRRRRPGRPRRGAARARPRPGRVPALARARPREQPPVRRGRRRHLLRRQALHARGARARAPDPRRAGRVRRAATRSATTRAPTSAPTGCTGSCRGCARGSKRGGVRFHWRTRVDALVLARRRAGPRASRSRRPRGELACDALVFAPGHSARDTWRALAAQGVAARGEAVPARRAHRAPAGARRPRPLRRRAAKPRCSAPPTTRLTCRRRRRRGRRAQLLHVSRRPDRRERLRAGPALHERHEQLAPLVAASRTPRS